MIYHHIQLNHLYITELTSCVAVYKPLKRHKYPHHVAILHQILFALSMITMFIKLFYQGTFSPQRQLCAVLRHKCPVITTPHQDIVQDPTGVKTGMNALSAD